MSHFSMSHFRKAARTSIHQRGVTLMELLVVITILGILSSIAVSSYRRYTLRANRSDGTMTLLRIQVAQEKAFLQYNRYAQTMAEVTAAPGASTPGLGITLKSGNITPGGFYVISLPSVGTSTPTYSVQADATGAQTQDTGCTSLNIDQSGARTPVASTGCWR